jgi:hypothetical protein
MKAKDPNCSFCGRKKSESLMLISGLDGHICDHCAEQANNIVEKELGGSPELITDINSTTGEKGGKKLPTPIEIKEHLDQYVIGQDQAKRTLSVAVYNHYKRLNSKKNSKKSDDVEIEKSNILMIGETGTGKEMAARAIHAASARGRLATTAERRAPKAGSGAALAATGSVRLTLASPGMQTSSHISHSAAALSVTLAPGARSAGGVKVTGRSKSPS